MASGIQMMFGQVMKQAVETMMPDIQENIAKLENIVAMFKAQLDRIEGQNDTIIRLLAEVPNGRQDDAGEIAGPDGSGGAAGGSGDGKRRNAVHAD